MYIVLGVIVFGIVASIALYARLWRRRQTEDTQEREDRLQRDAKTFASRIVSEIKLYNKALVADGHRSQDLYHQLQQNIDRGRMMYDKANDSIADRDYFHEAVVEILCDGNPDVLGEGYPGPRVHTIQ